MNIKGDTVEMTENELQELMRQRDNYSGNISLNLESVGETYQGRRVVISPASTQVEAG
jgi:hypothetical protein